MIRTVIACLVLVLWTIGCGTQPAAQPSAEKSVPSSDPPVTAQSAAQKPFKPEAESSIPSGTKLRVRLAESMDTERNRPGDRFTATLDAPLVVDGVTVLPKGIPFSGHLLSASQSGRLKGRAVMALTLDSFQLNGKSYVIRTTSTHRVSEAHKKRNLALIGGGAGLGAAIGGIAGGGKGALIGAGAGAAAGTAGAAATGKKNVTIPVETPLTFSLQAPVKVKVG